MLDALHPAIRRSTDQTGLVLNGVAWRAWAKLFSMRPSTEKGAPPSSIIKAA
jgi:hypothetical protein